MRSLRYEVNRHFEVETQRVWDAWTRPEEYGQWFGATFGSVEMDIRPGGSWRLVLPSDDGAPDEIMTGTYDEVVPMEKLVMTTHFPGGDTVMEMRFEPDAEGTLVTISQDCATTEERDGGRAGSLMLLEACAEYLTGMGHQTPTKET